jgi:hypothetical protein
MTADNQALIENILAELRRRGIVRQGEEVIARGAIETAIRETPGEWLLADPYP